MRSHRIGSGIAAVLLATTLAGCVGSNAPPIDPAAPADIRVTLPAPPAGVAACLREAFPEIPDRALSKADIVRIVGAAKVLDRAKRGCGERALAWIDAVRRDFAR